MHVLASVSSSGAHGDSGEAAGDCRPAGCGVAAGPVRLQSPVCRLRLFRGAAEDGAAAGTGSVCTGRPGALSLPAGRLFPRRDRLTATAGCRRPFPGPCPDGGGLTWPALSAAGRR